jgi:hypothetical protein
MSEAPLNFLNAYLAVHCVFLNMAVGDILYFAWADTCILAFWGAPEILRAVDRLRSRSTIRLPASLHIGSFHF